MRRFYNKYQPWYNSVVTLVRCRTMKGKLRYYFKQPTKSIVKDMLFWIMAAGSLAIAATSPYFVGSLLKSWKAGSKHLFRSRTSTFYRLRKQGFLTVEQKGHRYAVSLTKKGREKAGWIQLNDLAVKKQKTWSQKWYFLLFDIPQGNRWKRDVLRSFLERLEFVLFQKSVWVHAYDPSAELEILRELLGLGAHEVKLVIVPDEGLAREDSHRLRKRFVL